MKKSLFSLRTNKKDDSGASAVEFALIFPLLALILFGIITYGYILSFQQAVTQASSEGARAAAISVVSLTPYQKSQKAKVAIDEIMGSYGVECDDSGALTCTAVTAPCSGDPGSTCVKVTVEYDWKEEPRIPGFPGLPTPDKINHSTTVEVS